MQDVIGSRGGVLGFSIHRLGKKFKEEDDFYPAVTAFRLVSKSFMKLDVVPQNYVVKIQHDAVKIYLMFLTKSFDDEE